MPRVLMVYPEFPETFWGYQRALKLLGLRATHPPLGLLTVAGMLPESYDLRLVDLNIKPVEKEDWEWADMVLTGGMMIQRYSVESIVEDSVQARIPVVIGGPDATSSPEELPEAAHIIRGEAECPGLVESLSQIAHSDRRTVLDLREQSLGIDESPLPRYDIIDMTSYASMALQMSRGCPFKCEFCDIPFLFGDRTRYKPADKALSELDLLYERGWRGSVFWVDDNFIGNKKSCKEILPHVLDWQKRHDMPFQFYTQASVNLAGDQALIDLMVGTGFDSVFLGIETPVEASLRETKKLQNVRFDLLESVRKIQSAGMEVMGGFIIGFDNDPVDIDRHLIQFIQKSGIPVAMTGLLTAIPGSPLYDRFESEGRLKRMDSDREGNNTFQFNFNFKTVQDSQSLIKAYKNVLLEVYGKPENYFQRVWTLYRNLGRKAGSAAHPTRRRLMACLRSLIRIPSSRYWRCYGRFLIRTLFRYPARLPDAVRHGIVGAHFYQLTHDRLAVQEFDSFVSSALERVREAYAAGRHEGLKHAAQVLADGRERLRRLPSTVKQEMQELYEELESALQSLALQELPVSWESSAT